jgi:hypothetical protein
MTVSGSNLVGEMGPSAGGTGADLRAALTGTKPPDDAFAQSIAEAISMVTPEMTTDGALSDATGTHDDRG